MRKCLWLFATVVCAWNAQAYTLVKSSSWTLTSAYPASTSTSVETWDSSIYTDQTLDTANISLNISSLSFKSSTLLGTTTSSRPFAKVTLTVVDGEGNIETYTVTSARMQGGTAIDNGDGTYTYEFGAISPVSISVYNDEVDFMQSVGSGTRSFTVSFQLYDSSNALVNSGYTSTGAGAVDVSYVYTGTPVPEPATGALALAGIGLLLARRRRTA